jgi:hypothetical protein
MDHPMADCGNRRALKKLPRRVENGGCSHVMVEAFSGPLAIGHGPAFHIGYHHPGCRADPLYLAAECGELIRTILIERELDAR